MFRSWLFLFYVLFLLQDTIKIRITTNQSKKTCQIHYSHLAVDGKLRTEVTLKTLHEYKKISEKLGGESHHCEQCYAIPHELDRKYFVQPEPYRKFIFAQTIIKRKSYDGTRSSKRIKGNFNEQNNLFLDICRTCKKNKQLS